MGLRLMLYNNVVVYWLWVTKTERLPTKGTRSRNPQAINNHIILNH